MFRGLSKFWVDQNGAVTAEAWLVTGVLLMGSVAALVGLVERAGDAVNLVSNHTQVISAVVDLFIVK